jgi:hypothetical protein
MVVGMQFPKQTMHDVFMSKPSYAFHSKEGT